MLPHLIEWYGGSNPVLDCTRKLTGKVGVIINICSNVGSIPTTVTTESIPSEKKLNDFKILTREPNIYGTLLIQHKMKNLLQKIKKDEQMLWKSYQVYGRGVTKWT